LEEKESVKERREKMTCPGEKGKRENGGVRRGKNRGNDDVLLEQLR